MPRKADEDRLKAVWRLLQRKPGCRAGEYARSLGMHRYDFNTLLAMLNERGVLIAEDQEGRLWPWRG